MQVITLSCAEERPPLKWAPNDLTCVRKITSGIRTLSIFGTIRRDLGFYQIDLPPIEGGKVLIENVKGLEAKIDGDGNYILENVPPGLHKLKVFLPDSLSPNSLEQMFDLSQTVCLRQNFVVKIDGAITGKIIEFDGKPAVDVPLKIFSTTSNLYPAAEARTDLNGEYKLSKVPPGEYHLVVSQDAKTLGRRISFPSVFFPGITDYMKAEGIRIGYAEKLGEVNVRLPSKPNERMLTGKVIWADGKPVAGAKITYQVDEISVNLWGPDSYSDVNGNFFIPVLENTGGMIGASGTTKEGLYYSSRLEVFPRNQVPKEIKLIVRH